VAWWLLDWRANAQRATAHSAAMKKYWEGYRLAQAIAEKK
jgi:hypothetical protein